METRLWVGIDVAKADFEACLLEGRSQKRPRRFKAANDASGFASLASWARREAEGRDFGFCMEATGGYELELACYLAQEGFRLSVENPRRIKHFGIANGSANKTDRADARTIAAYALAMDPRPWRLSEEDRRLCSQMERHRESLVVELGRVRNRLEREGALPALVRRHLGEQERLLLAQIEEAQGEREAILGRNEALDAEASALARLPGVGLATAMVVLCEMPDVALFDDAQSWAAQAGMHPRRRESGKWRGQTKMSKNGNAHVRRILYM